MANEEKPTMGRIVRFKPASQDTSPAHEADVYPGIVTGTYAESDEIDICTFGQRSVYFQIRARRFDPEAPQLGGWSWPPRN